MNQFLLSALVIAVSTLNLHSAVTPTQLPASVLATSPNQGVVDTSPNANPLGLGEISITFKTKPAVNPSATGVAYCYMEGESEPVATATVENVYIDNMGEPMGGLSFKKKILSPGVYSVSIPEGFWLLGSADSPSPAIELKYEIVKIYDISPRAGVVDNLQEISISFPDADEVYRNEKVKPEFLVNNSSSVYNLVYNYITEEAQNKIVISFAQGDVAIYQITTPGIYLFFAPANAFMVRNYGPNFLEDPTDYTETGTPEIRVQYQIPSLPAPSIEPEQGLVKQFDTFTLTISDEMELMMVDDMAGSYIYEILPDGNIADNPLCRLKAQRVSEGNEFTLTVVGEAPIIPADGQYILRLASNLFSGMVNNEFTNSVAYEYWYEVNNSVGIETIDDTVSKNNTVYTFNGIRVLENADIDKLKSLPSGFYIVNGQKMVVR